MKNSVKAGALAIALCMGASFSGCSSAQEDTKGVLYVDIYNAGYGTDFIDTIGKAFEEKTGVKVVKTDIAFAADIQTKLESGVSRTDIFCNLLAPYNYLYSSKTIGGVTYDCLVEDLTDLYNSVPQGETKTVKDKMYDSYAEYHSFEKNGETKYYSFPWISGMTGLLVNNKLWGDSEIPRTTDELLEACARIKSEGKTPFIYCLEDSYWDKVTYIWAVQYEGLEQISRFETGYAKNGSRYTPDVMLYDGFLETLNVMESLFAGGYMHAYSASLDFTSVQNVFLEGKENIVMMPNGDWIQREMSENYASDELDISFMKIPVVSALGKKLGITEEELCAVIDYVDGKTQTVPEVAGSAKYAREEIVEAVAEARSLVPTLSMQHTAFIPAYSNEKENAKEFLKFMASDEGLRLFVKGSGGYTLPFDYDYKADEDTYTLMSAFNKQVVETVSTGRVYQLNTKDKLFCLGALQMPGNNLEEYVKFLAGSGSDYKNAAKIFSDDYLYVKGRWDTIKSTGGLS